MECSRTFISEIPEMRPIQQYGPDWHSYFVA